MTYDRIRAIGRVVIGDLAPALLATAILIGGSTGAARNDTGRMPLDALAYAILALAGVAFLLRRHLPLTFLAIEAAAAGTILGFGYPYGPILPAVGVAAFFFALRKPARPAAVAAVAAGLSLLTGQLVGDRSLSAYEILGAVAQLGWAIIPALIGGMARIARSARRHAAEEAQLRRVDDERLRLASEVHDVVGHGLSVISLQAGVALHILDREPEQARGALEAIRRASTDALDELRTTLALARHEAGAARRSPLSGLARLPSLLTEVRLCGLPVNLYVDGSERRLTADIDQVAFRIVQESLTNALRHSGATRVDVSLRWEPAGLRIVIDDDGQGLAAGTATGHGLAGLQERATEVGGHFRAGPRGDGGWRVDALLPVTGADTGQERPVGSARTLP